MEVSETFEAQSVMQCSYIKKKKFSKIYSEKVEVCEIIHCCVSSRSILVTTHKSGRPLKLCDNAIFNHKLRSYRGKRNVDYFLRLFEVYARRFAVWFLS